MGCSFHFSFVKQGDPCPAKNTKAANIGSVLGLRFNKRPYLIPVWKKLPNLKYCNDKECTPDALILLASEPFEEMLSHKYM